MCPKWDLEDGMGRGREGRVTVSIKGADVESQLSGPCTNYHNYSWTCDEQNHSSLGARKN